MRPVSPLQSALLRTGANVVSSGRFQRPLAILTYHRVLPETDPLLPDEPAADQFAVLMQAIKRTFNILTVREAVSLLESRRLPPRALCITFDDGYANNADVALPILMHCGIRATFFVATGFLNGGRMWNDSVIETVRRAREVLDLSDLGLGRHELPNIEARRKTIRHLLESLKYAPPAERARVSKLAAERTGIPSRSDLMMSDEQVRQLASRGMEIGAHTVNHPILAQLDGDAARQEIRSSRERLEAITGVAPVSFAYPNGRPGTDYRREHIAMVREAGFECAVSTAWGCATSSTDRYQLPRISPWGATAGSYVLRVVRSYLDRHAQRA